MTAVIDFCSTTEEQRRHIIVSADSGNEQYYVYAKVFIRNIIKLVERNIGGVLCPLVHVITTKTATAGGMRELSSSRVVHPAGLAVIRRCLRFLVPISFYTLI